MPRHTLKPETLKRAARWIREQMRKRKRRGGAHPFHLAADVMLEADKKFELGSFGVEGWADEWGNSGLLYLNMGDTYDPTIVVTADRRTAKVHCALGGWSPFNVTAGHLLGELVKAIQAQATRRSKKGV